MSQCTAVCHPKVGMREAESVRHVTTRLGQRVFLNPEHGNSIYNTAIGYTLSEIFSIVSSAASMAFWAESS